MRLKEVETPSKSITNGIKIGFKNLIDCLKSQGQSIFFARGNIQECIKAYYQMHFRFKLGSHGEIKEKHRPSNVEITEQGSKLNMVEEDE